MLVAAILLSPNCAAGQTKSTGRTYPSAELIENQVPKYRASIVNITSDGVRIQLPAGEKLVGLGDLRRLVFAEMVSDSPALESPITVALVDGSQFTCQQLAFDGTSVNFQIDANRTLRLTANHILSCQLQRLSDAQQTQWRAIVASRLSSDTLVLIRSAEALDKIEGIIRLVEPEIIKFEFDGQAIDAPRAKLAGLRFFSKEDIPASGKLLASVREKSGAQWLTKSVSTMASDNIECQLLCGAVISVPVGDVADIDFSQGNTRFLAELEPLEKKSHTQFSADISGLSELFGPSIVQSRKNASPIPAGPVLQFLGAGSITYRVPDSFQRLLGSAELDPAGTQFVPCRLRIFQEEKQLAETMLIEPRQPFSIELDVEQGKRVRLVVETDAAQPVGNVVVWKQMRFAK